jgi:cysteine synthase A
MSNSSNLIGNTPMINIDPYIWAKAEFLNPGGSIKDRPINFILQKMISEGQVKEGDTIIEATSGNTGISLSMLCAENGLNCKIVMPRNMSVERKRIICGYGAQLIEVDDGNFDAAIALRDQYCREKGWKTTNQFHSQLNIQSHQITGAEIVKNCQDLSIQPIAFIAGTGTGGTLMGASSTIKESFPNCKIVAVEPSESPVMSGGSPGIHGIQGIGDGSKFLVDLEKLDKIVLVSTEESIQMSLWLARNRGTFVGFSAAANFIASRKMRDELNPKEGEAIITILCDRGERYTSILSSIS